MYEESNEKMSYLKYQNLCHLMILNSEYFHSEQKEKNMYDLIFRLTII